MPVSWKEYEDKVLNYFKGRFPDGTLFQNKKLVGHKSGVPREIDILIEK